MHSRNIREECTQVVDGECETYLRLTVALLNEFLKVAMHSNELFLNAVPHDLEQTFLFGEMLVHAPVENFERFLDLLCGVWYDVALMDASDNSGRDPPPCRETVQQSS